MAIAEPQELVVVGSREQLAAVAGLPSLLRLSGPGRIALRIPDVPLTLQEATERRLAFWLAVCGCQPGALCLFAAIAWLWAYPLPSQGSFGRDLLAGGGAALAAAITGKVVALAIARVARVAETAFFLRSIRRPQREAGIA
jgi:hypothetical protein